MPVVIREIVIKTNVETSQSDIEDSRIRNNYNIPVEEIVKQAVAKVLEILEEKKER